MRTLSASFLAAAESSLIRPRFLLEIETTGSTLRYWTGKHNVSWNSQTWVGNGFFQRPDQISESDEDTGGLNIELQGEPSAILSTILSSLQRDKTLNLYLAFLDSSEAIISGPISLFTGFVDEVTLEDRADEALVNISAISKVDLMDRSSDLRLNQETQQHYFSGDVGFEYLPALEDWSGTWGKIKKKRPKKNGKEAGANKHHKPRPGKKQRRNRGRS